VQNAGREFAMKVFPRINRYYTNEIRCSFLNSLNENILAPQHFFTGYIDIDGVENEIQFTLSEYCPNGDLYLIKDKGILLEEKVTRTLFHQMVEAVDCLHSHKIAHGDIKVENIFLDKNYQARLADFDLSHKEGVASKLSEGTVDWRAPEVGPCNDYDPYPADVFALGLVLFFLFNGRVLPFRETREKDSLQSLYFNDNLKFWTEFKKSSNLDVKKWDSEFIELFTMMTKLNPAERLTIKQIKQSKWYNREIYDKEDLKIIMRSKYSQCEESFDEIVSSSNRL
jgi:serine/threonine protein kinase